MRTLNVSDYVHEDVPHLEPLADSRVYDTDKLGKGEIWAHTYIIRMKTHNEGMPRLLLIRDSFANHFANYLSEHMSETILVHHRRGLFEKSFIELHQPDIVIYEIVERHLNEELYDVE